MRELNDVALVGHSFGGLVISGVADRIRQRIKRLIYLDALIVQAGQSAMSMLPPAVQLERSRTIDAEGLRMQLPTPDRFGVFEPQQVEWIARRTAPHPLKAYTEVLGLQHPLGNGLPKTYIAVTDPWYAPLAGVREWIRAQADWEWQEIATGHDAMVTAPDALTGLLLEFTH
jgi:pimeloyl-ACP methyl ester carboxylesterase